MSKTPPQQRSVLYSFNFLGTAIVGSLLMALVCAFAPPEAQLAVLGAFISILGGLFISYMEQEHVRDQRRNEVLERLAVPLSLAPEHDLYQQYLAFCKGLSNITPETDPILREMALLKLASINAQIASLANGTVVFAGTETWRTVYDALLDSPSVKEYQSVAWVRSKDYWQDAPGKQSMQANFEAAHRGVLIERIVILRDDLWPKGQVLPTGDILPWLEEQNNHGLHILVLRESDVASETDLLADVGIYGERACGTQELDERSRTVRFVLQFDAQAVRLAKNRWQRISIFATPLITLLDQIDKDL